MLRKVIFIGQTTGQTIYFDTKNKKILKRASNALLDMKGSHNNGRNAALGVLLLLSIGGLAGNILQKFASGGGFSYTRPIIFCLALLWLAEIIGLCGLLERALYRTRVGKKSDFVPASKAEFSAAYRSNIIFVNPKGKKITRLSKLGAFLLTLLIALLGLITFLMMLVILFSSLLAGLVLLGQPIGSEFFALLVLGVMPFAGYLFVFQNNPFRWLLAVEKYKKGELI